MKKYFLLVFSFLSLHGFPQQHEIDSLDNLLSKKNVADTTKISALFRLTELLYLRNLDTIVPLSRRALVLTNKGLNKNPDKKLELFLLKGEATAYNNLGVYFTNVALPDSAIKYYKRSIRIQLKADDMEEIPNTYNNIGYIYKKEGKVELALKYYRKALFLAEKYKQNNHIGITCLNIGHVYAEQEDYEKALEYFQKSLKHYGHSGNKYGLSMAHHNLGSYYETNKMDLSKALEHYETALKLKEEVGDIIGMAYTLNNIGHVYGVREEKDKALKYFIEAYNIFSSQKYIDGLANSAGNVSKAYLERGDYANALKYGEEALRLANETGFPENIKNASLIMYNVYDKRRDFAKAIDMYRRYCEMRDSMNNDKTRKAAIESQIQFKYDRKNLKDSLEHEKENELSKAENEKLDAELKAKQSIQILLYGGLILVIVFAVFMYNRFRITRKQNKVIEEQKKEVEVQKHIVEEKQKEIIDSINYAQRLQKAILAPKSEIDKYIPENFLFYQPKDIVAGDFYFFEVTPSHIFYAAADCTGHGVPGAMVSIVCANALMRCVKEFNLSDPGRILDKTRELILETFQKSGEDVKDGMDISLLAIDRKDKSKRWAGAHNPLWYTMNGEMKEIMADKQPIGKTDHFKPFTTHVLQEGINLIFLFTDGYADQFGGLKGKKFKNANLKKLLLENENRPGKEFEQIIHDAFDNWKGDLEQVDDICIIGVKI